ncbi:MAG TPA: hypothetical protein VJR06_08255 [Nitrososphaerales archaeon]|nr:hypothetical protein [Nitrososphaerales archaeon]
MVVFILSFRSQNVAIRDAAYQKALDDYTASISMLVQNPELGAVIDDMGQGVGLNRGLAEKDRTVFGYMLLNYSLFERVYLLYEKRRIDEDTWTQWHNWMKTMAKHPMFQEVHRRSQGTFDTDFQRLVEEATTQKG